MPFLKVMALAKLCSGHLGSACGHGGWRARGTSLVPSGNISRCCSSREGAVAASVVRWAWARLCSAAELLPRTHPSAPRGPCLPAWTLHPCMDLSSLHGAPSPCMNPILLAGTPSSPHGPSPPHMDPVLLAGATSSMHGPPPPHTDPILPADTP